MEVQVRITNLPEIRAAFKMAPQLTAKKMTEAIEKSAFLIERESKVRTPVDTGFLRASHRTTFAPLQATIEPTADYAIYVHQGTRYMRGRPFLFNAVRYTEGSIERFFVDAVQDVLDDIARRTQ